MKRLVSQKTRLISRPHAQPSFPAFTQATDIIVGVLVRPKMPACAPQREQRILIRRLVRLDRRPVAVPTEQAVVAVWDIFGLRRDLCTLAVGMVGITLPEEPSAA